MATKTPTEKNTPTPDNTNSLLTLIFLHPRSSDTFEAELGISTTGNQALAELRKANWLPDPGRGAFTMSANGVSLDLSKPLAGQGLTNGSRVLVSLTGIAAAGSVTL